MTTLHLAAAPAPALPLAGRVTCKVSEAAAFLEISERSLRRALEPDGDLAHLALRVGSRVLVKVTPLLALVEASA